MGHSPGLHLPGYLLILVVFVFPFWVWLVNEESHEVFFSGLFENCLAIKCWKPRHLSSAICLFQASACLGCHLLSISQSIEETEGILHLVNPESLGG
ncbi:PREDICTED: transmembrane protein 225-like [Ceratotherium simum simum]|uniref:Transmembrane protein 225-like n=1 Tax=Ceratotherium simum simum TaxID=73337 RepID=A0ABM1DLB7_CERSS|nr:PREDICTED: transmembrane protein 225-like [Ceratotherium simum simum]